MMPLYPMNYTNSLHVINNLQYMSNNDNLMCFCTICNIKIFFHHYCTENIEREPVVDLLFNYSLLYNLPAYLLTKCRYRELVLEEEDTVCPNSPVQIVYSLHINGNDFMDIR